VGRKTLRPLVYGVPHLYRFTDNPVRSQLISAFLGTQFVVGGAWGLLVTLFVWHDVAFVHSSHRAWMLELAIRSLVLGILLLATSLRLPMLVFNRRQLEAVLSEFVDHYNSHRPHRSLQRAPPIGTTPVLVQWPDSRFLRRSDRLGGLIHEYGLAA
jgi:transposase InsO family protein